MALNDAEIVNFQTDQAALQIPLIERVHGGNKFIHTSDKVQKILPGRSVRELLEFLPLINSDTSIPTKFIRDLIITGIINDKRELTAFGSDFIRKNKEEQSKVLKEKINQLPKVQILQKIFLANPKIRTKELLSMLPLDFFDGKETSSKLTYVSRIRTWFK